MRKRQFILNERKRKNLGDQISEIAKLKDKARSLNIKTTENYIFETKKVCKSVLNKLTHELDKFEKDNQDEIEICDNIVKILLETDYISLEKAKDEYDFWSDLNDKFNS